MKFHLYLLKISTFFVVTTCFSTASAETKRPNIIWIVGDDLGDDLGVELGCYGNPDVRTPNSDRLAAGGICYSNSFSTAPVCSASRSAFITGMYQTHFGLQAHRKMLRVPLPEGVEPITTYLKQVGYTCMNTVGLGPDGKKDFNFEPETVFDSDDMAVMEKLWRKGNHYSSSSPCTSRTAISIRWKKAISIPRRSLYPRNIRTIHWCARTGQSI